MNPVWAIAEYAALRLTSVCVTASTAPDQHRLAMATAQSARRRSAAQLRQGHIEDAQHRAERRDLGGRRHEGRDRGRGTLIDIGHPRMERHRTKPLNSSPMRQPKALARAFIAMFSGWWTARIRGSSSESRYAVVPSVDALSQITISVVSGEADGARSRRRAQQVLAIVRDGDDRDHVTNAASGPVAAARSRP